MKSIKVILTILVLFTVSLSMTSCSSSNTPEAVTKKFLTLLQEGKIQEAKELCDGKTKSLLNMLDGFIEEAALSSKDKKMDIKIISSEIDGDNAIVTYIGEEGESEKVMNLRKIEGKWKVSMDKEGLNKEG